MRCVVVIALAVVAVACGGDHRFGGARGAWVIQHPGLHNDSTTGDSVIAMPDGGTALVWAGRLPVGKTVMRLDRYGAPVWSVRLADTSCSGTRAFVSGLAALADGSLVVVNSGTPDGSICALRIDAAGATLWARQLDELHGMAHLAITAQGEIAIAGYLFVPHLARQSSPIALLGLDGATRMHVDLPIRIAGLVVEGRDLLAIGRSEDGTAQLMAVDHQGGQHLVRTLDSALGNDQSLYLASDGAGAVYAGWRERGSVAVARLAADHSDRWKRTVPSTSEARLAAGPDGAILATRGQLGTWTIVELAAGDGAPAPEHRLESSAAGAVGVRVVAPAPGAILVSGWVSKHAQLDGDDDLVLITPCRTAIEYSPRGDPHVPFTHEYCQQFGWVARLSPR